MTRIPILQVDVFTETPLEGNPLAVVPDATGLSDRQMQSIARETNLSETTFVLPASAPAADYRMRIFTPRQELPFAGHPTIGTAHALLVTGALKRDEDVFTLRQQTLAGVQPIEVSGESDRRDYLMTQPTPRFETGPTASELAAALRIDPADIVAPPVTVSVGVAWHIAALRDLERVRSLDPDMQALTELEARTGTATTVFCREAQAPDCEVRVRSFAPGSGIPEDPVCGSGNGCVGAFLAETGQAQTPLRYTAEQGIEMGRPGRVRVRVESGADGYVVQVGGRAVTLLSGELSLPAR